MKTATIADAGEISGKELILATRPFAKENRALSWLYTLSTLLLMSCAVAVVYLPVPLLAKIPVSIVAGLLIVRMFVIYHDFEHHAILDRSKAARALMTVYGLYILAPPGIWKRSHDYHHKHNSKLFSASIGSYPIMTKAKFVSASKGERAGYLFSRHPLTIFLGYFTMFIWGMCVQSFRSSPSRHFDSFIALLLHATAYALTVFFCGWLTALLAWTIPFTIACGIGSYLFYAQHNFPGVTFRDNAGWTYEGAAMESSSFMKLNPVMMWFTGNIGYHHIHHLNSRIPFYRLPEVMEKIPAVRHPKTTTMKPRDVWACLRLKVWDPEKQEMIPLSKL